MSSVEVPAARLVSELVPGPAGPLEGLLRLPARPDGAAVVAHPHPLHGGTMHTKVVHRAARLLADRFSLLTLRFNFRGVGASAGIHDEGRGEVDDLVAAAEWVRARQPAGPFVAGGFSFGSACAVRAARRLSPDLLFLIGFPLALWKGEVPSLPGTRVVWIQGARDTYGPVEGARELAARQGWTLRVVEGGDHFFTGRLEAFEEAAVEALSAALERKPS